MTSAWATRSAWCATYCAAVLLGRQLVLEESGLALLWPAAGVAILWLLADDRPRWVDGALLFGVTVVLNVVLGAPVAAGFLFGTANVVQATVAASIVVVARSPRASGPAALVTQRDLVVLVGATLTAALLSAAPGTAAGWVASGHWSVLTLVGWVARNAVGSVVVVALVLVVRGCVRQRRASGATGLPPVSLRGGSVHELVVASLVSLVVLVAVFAAPSSRPLAFLVIATTAWVGARFVPWVVAVHTTVQAALVLALTLAGRGPFGALAALDERALVAQCFVAVNSLLALLLALGAAERERLLVAARRAESESRRQAELLTAVSDVMRDGLLVLDAGGRVVHANPAAYALTGLDPDRDVDLHDAARHGFVAPDGSDLAPERLPHTRALAGERVEPMDVLRRATPDSAEQLISMTGTSLRDDDGRPMAVVGLRDVTVERLEKRELEAFAGVVAHDLKNPIAAVLSWCEILDDQIDPLEGGSDARGSLTRIYSATDRMRHLVEDLLEYARTGTDALGPQPLVVDDVVADVAAGVGLTVAGTGPVGWAGARVELRAPHAVQADPVLVRQLFTNLLTNAVKYVPPGTTPRVSVSSRRTGDHVEVAVQDNGIGIPRADRSRIFDSFYRASNSGRFPGTGLGLAICARAVERHGGTIAVSDAAGGSGTRVVFTLPAVLSAAPVPTGVDRPAAAVPVP